MYFVYILKNNLTQKHYIGSTNNISRRLTEHNRHQTRSTSSVGKWFLIYKEEYQSKQEAVRRELKIKSYKGGNAFKKLFAGVVQR